ncbi:exopolysaccharide biosynthesis polyprenyl glycosylphosphotransferase [Xanthobacter tagetidis]|jgi:putative colanic acid biosynthesis UDP-glucose lipid carrier transferase|uniref:Exopolysaccharide biosynthesis polyprenyl glycosylphosphotransferase n=1 Tax=Xanthobacter tagetidis TaxID=60216 RepID=A0A3L7ANT5_9HYPH|nr:exopolysaccharide biosynthesis polyprenyl glycosylphosphotransferase [Xanthobacter tagetidis]MBB6308162.1 putative colanic acid biosynthesis UDP-glucose lipid carrier transferase [Xanthobacter tagetidis]RLP81784.1 exopolysaccharide biosynthesis polyprenyl glycosylphosphotransferase [Xanthobacter tagetidis]
MTRWTHGLVNRLVILCDVVMAALAAIIAHLRWEFLSWSQMVILWVLGAFVFIQILQIGRAYRVEHYVRPLRQIGHLVVAGVPAGAIVAVAYYAIIPNDDTNLWALLGWGGLTAVCLIFGRLVLVRLGISLVRRHEVLHRDVVLVGDRERCRALVRRYQEEHAKGGLLAFVGIFDDQAGRPDEAAPPAGLPPVMGDLGALLEYAKDASIDMVVICKSWRDPTAINAIAEQMYRIAADVVVELDPDEFMLNYANLTVLAGEPALMVQQQPLKGSLGLLKWVEDYVVATIGLILTAPILLAAAVAIKLDSPGPVLFRQPRLGLNNKVFQCYKLRTMQVDPADDGSKGTTRNDPRITKVGAFLRSTSIDELPQLLNVLKGDMSVVGPRPHVPNMEVTSNVRYEAIRQYVARYRMKPGITGWAQINGMRGGIHTLEKAERGVELDLFYIENWSIWFDIRIMILTITKGMAGSNVF